MNGCSETAVRRSWRLPIYLKFGIYLIREITFLTASERILTSDVCGNHVCGNVKISKLP